MVAPNTQSSPEKASRRAGSGESLRALDKVRAVFTSISKYINAKTIYSKNNPTVEKFAGTFYKAFREYFEVEKELLLTIDQYQIKWRDEIVYDNRRKNESIAFLLYKDGVGEIAFLSSVTRNELDRFVDIVKNEIYNPSAHLDVVNKLWESEFKSIYYRVYDESPEGTSGDGRGSGGDRKEHPLCVNDHPVLSNIEDDNARNADQHDRFFQSIDSYFAGVVERCHPSLSASGKELCIQRMLQSFFALNTDALKSWHDDFDVLNAKDKLLWLLDIMFDFTQMQNSPPVVRDILDMTERLLRNIMLEARITSLIAVLVMHKKLVLSKDTALDFRPLVDRIELEFTSRAFLLALGKIEDRPTHEARQLLLFFEMLGEKSLPGLCEFLKNIKDPSLRMEACDLLLDLVGDRITEVVDDFDLDDPQEARNAIYLLQHSKTDEVSPVIKKLMSSPHIQVRELLPRYMVCIANDEAASLLCILMKDADANVRTKAFSAAEEFAHPLVVGGVVSSCFDQDNSTKSMDELERTFRSAGIIAGASMLDSIKQMMRKKKWLPFRRGAGQQDKLLAVVALKHIAGPEALNLLKELSCDSDVSVRTKAMYALKRLEGTDNACSEDQLETAGEKVEQ